MLNGMTNQTALAVRHNVSQFTTHHDVRAILEDMNEEQKELGKQELVITLHRLEDNIREATNAWERSKESKEETRTVNQLKKCDDCKGTGIIGKKQCNLCKGDGFHIEEVTTRTVIGEAGDPAFLKERRECMRLKCYILGISVKPNNTRRPKEQPHNTKINVINITSNEVIEAMVSLHALKRKAIEAKIIEKDEEY